MAACAGPAELIVGVYPRRVAALALRAVQAAKVACALGAGGRVTRRTGMRARGHRQRRSRVRPFVRSGPAGAYA